MMNDPTRAAFWAALQAELLVVSAVLVFGYLLETRRMRKAAQAQVAKSQELVQAADRQLEASRQQLAAMQVQTALAQDQLEAQIRPAVTLYDDPNCQRYIVRNVGSGPALDLRFVMQAGGSTIQWSTAPNVLTSLNGSALWVGSQDGAVVPRGGNEQQEMQVIYKSLSGREYASVIRFNNGGAPVGTRLEVRG